jgi:hypothetical protein
MRDSHSSSWKEPYLEALRESDKEKLTELVHATVGNVPSLAGTGTLCGRSRRTKRNSGSQREFANSRNSHTWLVTAPSSRTHTHD